MTTTWVPLEVPDWQGTARLLDDKRLNAQRGGEGLITVRAILAWMRGDEMAGWQNHPAPTMWRGHLRALCEYQIEMCREWRRRGYDDYCLGEYLAVWQSIPGPTTLPPWYGRTSFHRQQRSALASRLPAHYAHLFPDADPAFPDTGFDWPVPTYEHLETSTDPRATS